MPAFARLPADLQLQLKKQVQVLVAEKPFIGCAGLVVTEEMRVLVAAQAALLLLNRRAGDFPEPARGAAVSRRLRRRARAARRRRAGHARTAGALSGESWQRGQVILSWDDVLAGAADPGDGRNVVIHEFAHQLDQESGRANGAPFLGRRDRYPALVADAGRGLRPLAAAASRAASDG